MSLTAAEAQKLGRFLNPWALHLQKLGLELKCPLCLNLLNKPMLFPCNHVFCNACVPKSAQFGYECLACQHHFRDEEIRPAPFIENMVTIYRSLDATFSATVLQSLTSDAGVVSEPSLVTFTKGIEDKSRRDLVRNPQEKEEVEQRGRCGTNSNSESQFGPFQRVGNANGLQTEEIDMKHVPQLSPGSSNSFNDIKDIDKSSGDPQSRTESAEKCKSRKSVEDESDKSRNQNYFKITCDGMFQARDAKRQKKLSYGLADSGAESYGHTQQGSCTEDIAISNCKMQLKLGEHKAVAQSVDTNRSVCAFCHSSKLTDGTGAMLYYANGKEVVGDVSNLCKVTPVHRKCIEWTPQVYYEGDSIKNLESELARAAKLKCSRCGMKGAALGCFAKSCRKTYHVPCAFDIQECRWDCDDFLMLCPSHNNAKFPREKSKRVKFPREKSKPETCSSAGNHLVSDQILSRQSNFWAAFSDGPKEWVLCGSALSPEDKFTLVRFARLCGATVTKNWKPSVTQVIAATDANGACSRTLKVLMAILHGRWILRMDWVKACMEANCPVNEEPCEVGLDNHGCRDGPKTGRLRASTNAPKLFDGLRFYFSGDFVQAYRYDLLDLVQTAGGVIIESKEQLMAESQVPQATSSSCIIVYNRDPQGSVFGEEETIVLRRLEAAKDLATETASQVIRHTWILESIAACKLLPFCC